MGIVSYLNWFNNLKSKKVSLFESISGLEEKVLLDKNEKGLCFKMPFKDSKILYKDDTDFFIQDNEVIVKLKSYLISNSSFGNKIVQSYIFETKKFDEDNKYFFKYFSKIDDVFFISNFLNEAVRNFKLTKDNINYKISTSCLTIDFKGDFLCIEVDEKISFKEFKYNVNCLILSIGFCSGYLFKKEEYFFQSNTVDFLDCEFFYRSQNKRFSTYLPFTSTPQEFSGFYHENFKIDENYVNKYASRISIAQFQNLNLLISENPEYYSSVRLLFEIIPNSFISKHSVLFVVLETIAREVRNKFHSEHIGKVLIREEALNELKQIKDSISDESFEILSNALNNIDVKKTKNIVDFELAFSSLKIKLTKDDRKSLKRRNDILHGRIIDSLTQLNFEEDYVNLEIEYNFFSYKLYTLICKLILKQIDFNGYLLNHSKFYTINRNLTRDESYFINL